MSESKNSILIPFSLLVFLCLLCLSTQNVFAGVTKTGLPDYVLGTGDTVRIQVYDEEDLYLESRVSDRGTISYPFLGELKVIGLTPGNLEKIITSKLKGDYLINPKVSIDIIEYREFYVNGEVEDPGGFPFQPGVTVRKAISIAGGFKERASKDSVNVIHDDDPGGEPRSVKLDEYIRPGDIITVEESFF